MTKIIINWLERFYLRFPPLSPEVNEYTVKILPVLSVIFGILLIIASIAHIIGSSIFAVFTLEGRTAADIQILLLREVISIAQGILMVFAVPSLNRHQTKGWKLLFYAQVLWIITSVLSGSPWLIISLILFYFFFQVKKYYQ